jgi:Ser/Thr protein kinase RdoA (MazF antagonist)
MINVPENVLSTLATGFQVQPGGLTFLGGGRLDSDGIVYTYARDHQPYVLKILAFRLDDPDALVRLGERLKFVHFLGEREAPIVNPQPLPGGSLYLTQEAGQHLFVAYTYPKIEGASAGRMVWFDPIVRPWGVAVGALHRLTQSYPTWQSSPVGNSGRSVLGWHEEWQSFYDACQDQAVQKCWLSICERLEALPVQREAFGFIHNDPHSGNILITHDHIVLLDFDVANYHWFVNDIAIALQSLLFKQTGGLDRPCANAAPLHHFLEGFMEGYSWENSLDSFWLEQIDLFIAYRRILGYIVMQDWLRNRPAQRATWKAMILEEPTILR